MEKKLLLRVTKSFPLTGLGVLLFPDELAADLTSFELHAALALTLCYPDGREEPAVASVEEVARPGTPATHALLLTHEGATPVPVGTEVWWAGEATSWYAAGGRGATCLC